MCTELDKMSSGDFRGKMKGKTRIKRVNEEQTENTKR